MSEDLLDWISRQGQVSGDARQELVRAGRRHGWSMQKFASMICGEPMLHKELVNSCTPFEIAVLGRAWRMDFGAPAPQQSEAPRRPHDPRTTHLKERQHYRGGHDHMYELDDYDPADEVPQEQEYRNGINGRESRNMRKAWADSDPIYLEQDRMAPLYPQAQVEPSRRQAAVGDRNSRAAPRSEDRAAPRAERQVAPKAQAWADSDYVEQNRMHSGGEPSRRQAAVGDRNSWLTPGSEDWAAPRAERQVAPNAEALADSDYLEQDRMASLYPPAQPSSGEPSGRQAAVGGRNFRSAPSSEDWAAPRAERRVAPKAEVWAEPIVRAPSAAHHENGHARPDRRPCERREVAFEEDAASLSGHPRQQMDLVDLRGAYAIAASPDGSSVYVAGRDGLLCFAMPGFQLCASASYEGPADPPGYADVAAGNGFVVCADINGNLYRHDAVTCELQAKRAYQPSVMEHSQRVVASNLQRFSAAIVGLEGGFGGASRLAVGPDAVYLGGRDGVITAYSAGSLNITARSRLQEGPLSTPIGVRSLFLAPATQRLYCSVLSSVHVLATPSMREVSRLRGGPRVPVFGNVSCAVESSSGKLAFVADVGGPSIHVWDTSTWQWLARVELSEDGGPACQLAVDHTDTMLYVATRCSRFLAFDCSRRRPQCREEGAGGGPMVVLPPPANQLVVLAEGRLQARPH